MTDLTKYKKVRAERDTVDDNIIRVNRKTPANTFVDDIVDRFMVKNTKEVTLSSLQAILGDTIEVETVDGSEQLEIPPGTQPGTVLTLTGKGVPKLGNPVARGNHLFTVKVQLPTKLSADERQLLEELAGHHTRRGHKHPHKSGLFGGLFGQRD
jgi:DnaJ-class molecular chaperone